MFSEMPQNIKALIKFVKLLNVNITNSSINEVLKSHPYWPSMLSISDGLKKWNIPNAVAIAGENSIDEIPTPFLAYTTNSENPLAIVAEVSNEHVKVFQKSYKKFNLQTREEFIKNWKGIYLIAEPSKNAGEKDYRKKKTKTLLKQLLLVLPLLLFDLFSVIFFNSSLKANLYLLPTDINISNIYTEGVILVLGILISFLLLWYEIDRNNPVLHKVCTGFKKGNCEAILTGKRSKVFRWLSWSEIGFFYFTGGALTLLFSGNNISSALFILALFHFLALPYILFSVFYQWRVAKYWCTLCLSIQVLLLTGGINAMLGNFLHFNQNIPLGFLVTTILLYLSPISLWFSIKPFLLRFQQGETLRNEYSRLKFNTEIFDTLLKRQKQISVSTDDLGIDIGNPKATNTIVKVCNPYCGPCALAHPKIDSLIDEIRNLKVKIIFSTGNFDNSPGIRPTRHLIAIASSSNNQEIIRKALDDWYLPNVKDYDQFALKYPMNGELLKQGEKIEAMKKWCNKMEIGYTPTFFVNGHQLPEGYDIEDLRYFFTEQE